MSEREKANKNECSPGRSHLWLMLLGCGAMLLGFRYLAGTGGTSFGWILLLACPLMHVFMMLSAHRDER